MIDSIVRDTPRFWSGALFYGLAAAVMMLPQGCSKNSGSAPAAVANQSMAWRGEAETFRLLGTADLLRGLQVYGTPAANLRFAALGNDMFPGSDWQANWQLFLSTSLTNLVLADSNKALVGYYHPWSDVMLLTHWRKGADGKSQIESVDVLPGSAVRGDNPPSSFNRSWQSGETFAPEAVARITVETTRAFESRFGNASSDHLARLDEETKQALPTIAWLSFADFRLEVARLFVEDKSKPVVLGYWNEVQDAARSGHTGRSGALGDGIKAIGKLNSKIRESLSPVSYLSTEKSELLILASQVEPNLFVVLQTGGPGGKGDLRRVDLLSFQTFYDATHKAEAR